MHTTLEATLGVMEGAFSTYQRALQVIIDEAGYWYRSAVYGSHGLAEGHPALAQAEEFGFNCATHGIDVVEGYGDFHSIMGRVAHGHNLGRKQSGSTARAFANSLTLPWENGAKASDGMTVQRHVVFRNAALATRMDLFSAFSVAFVLFEGGWGTGLEAFDAAQRVQFGKKIAPEIIPQGIRLQSLSAKLGYHPAIIAIGPSYGWLEEAQRTFGNRGLCNPANGEDQIIHFAPDGAEAFRYLQEMDRPRWETFLRERGVEPMNPIAIAEGDSRQGTLRFG